MHGCHEACGGQGLKTKNCIDHLKGKYDTQSTFEGNNNVLMQQLSRLTKYMTHYNFKSLLLVVDTVTKGTSCQMLGDYNGFHVLFTKVSYLPYQEFSGNDSQTYPKIASCHLKSKLHKNGSRYDTDPLEILKS